MIFKLGFILGVQYLSLCNISFSVQITILFNQASLIHYYNHCQRLVMFVNPDIYN